MPVNPKKRKQLTIVRKAIRDILRVFDKDLKDPDLRDTPDRVARLFYEELVDQKKDVKKLLKVFPSKYKSMVVIRNHRAFTRCPHHLERVILNISIAYIPNGWLLGLSKPERIADYYSKGLMLQEEITESIAEGLMSALKPLGVAVLVEAEHMCMHARGVKSTHSDVAMEHLTGVFDTDAKVREEFHQHLLRGRR